MVGCAVAGRISKNPPGTSLESPTKLDGAKVPPREGRWLLNLYPDAAEAGGCLQSAARRSGAGSWCEAEADPDRSAGEAVRRARGRVRRYCAANRTNRLADLTYAGAGCFDPAQHRLELGDFFKRLRSAVGRPFPYLWVPEWHKNHGLHAHFAVNRFIPRGQIEEAWGRGFVWIHFHGDLPVGSGALEEARLNGRYLAKYIGKDLGHGSDPGLHRYEVAQGFQPRWQRLVGASLGEVLAQAAAIMGREPELVWDSSTDPTWAGPRAVWASWTA